MNATGSTLTRQTVTELTELVDAARQTTARARRAGAFELMREARHIGHQLDAMRTDLVRDGVIRLDAAKAVQTAGILQIGGIVSQLDRLDLGIDRIAAERVEAADVIAWLEWHAIHVYPWQRRAIERHLAA